MIIRSRGRTNERTNERNGPTDGRTDIGKRSCSSGGNRGRSIKHPRSATYGSIVRMTVYPSFFRPPVPITFQLGFPSGTTSPNTATLLSPAPSAACLASVANRQLELLWFTHTQTPNSHHTQTRELTAAPAKVVEKLFRLI